MYPEGNKETALVAVEGERLPVAAAPQKSSYWGRVSVRYTAIARSLIVILLLVVVVFALIFSRVFTYDSLFSFVKDLQNLPSFVPANYDTVYASYSEGNAATLYRGSIAFVGNGGVEVYAPDGSRLLDVPKSFARPRVTASDKYLLAYDLGGKDFSVTNAYGELFEGESEFPILGAAVSDKGYFALITTSNGHISRLALYDEHFNLIHGINRNTATVGVAFTDADTVAILGATAGDGSIYTAVDTFTVGDDSTASLCVFENEMPLALDSTGDRTVLLTDRALRALDEKGNTVTELACEGTLVDLVVNKHGTLLVLEVDAVTAANRLVFLDEDGVLMMDSTHMGDVRAAALSKTAVFLLGGGFATCISIKDQSVHSVQVDVQAQDILATQDRAARVIYPAKAVYVNFESLDK